MDWYKFAKSEIENTKINRAIKDRIRTNPFFKYLFEDYGVPIDRIDDNLSIEVTELNGKFAKSDSKKIYLNKKLFENGSFFAENFHFVIHELTHWLTRQKERQFYFADPEEVEAFACAMCFELDNGKKKEEIQKVFFPIIEAHFDQKHDANKLFEALFTKAVNRLRKYR